MSQRTNLLLADILGWILVAMKLFAIMGLLLGRIGIADALVSLLVLLAIGWVVGKYEHALRQALEPELTERMERAVNDR